MVLVKYKYTPGMEVLLGRARRDFRSKWGDLLKPSVLTGLFEPLVDDLMSLESTRLLSHIFSKK